MGDFEDLAYNLWYTAPIMTTFDAVKKELAQYLEPAGTPDTTPSPSSGGSGMSAGLIVVIVLVAIAVLAGGIFGFTKLRRGGGVAPRGEQSAQLRENLA